MSIKQEPIGSSFRPWMSMMLALVVGGPLLFSLGQRWGIFLTAVAGCVPFTFQLYTGRALDGSGVARYSRIEEPLLYWGGLLAGILLALMLGYGAYRVYLSGTWLTAAH
jgi:hypothetical protein